MIPCLFLPSTSTKLTFFLFFLFFFFKTKKLPQSHPDVVLVADVGGTNARFVLTRVGEGDDGSNSNGEEILQVVYPTNRHATFADALAALEREPSFVAPRAAAFAVAGPVARNRCEMTNLSWTIDGDFLSKKLGEFFFFRFFPLIRARGEPADKTGKKAKVSLLFLSSLALLPTQTYNLQGSRSPSSTTSRPRATESST